MQDFLCVCGHLKSRHNLSTEFINGENLCYECDSEMHPKTGLIHWHKYKPDNLKYLESLYESRT